MKSYYPVQVEVLDNYCLKILFDNQEQRIFDVKPYLSDPFFHAISNQTIFSTARVNPITVEWDGDIDICPDELYEKSILITKNL